MGRSRKAQGDTGRYKKIQEDTGSYRKIQEGTGRRGDIRILLFLIISSVLISACGVSGGIRNRFPDRAALHTEDVDRFWAAYEKIDLAEDPTTVFTDLYFDRASLGLKKFQKLRIGETQKFVAFIRSNRFYYDNIKEETLKVEEQKDAILESFRKLRTLYDSAVFPDVYFMIGRMNSGGTVTRTGLLIGTEMHALNPSVDTARLSSWHKSVLQTIERLPAIVAHELIHYQQRYGQPLKRKKSLLHRTIREGAADFIGELISGKIINAHLHEYARGKEREIWLDFKREMQGSYYGNWLYNGSNAKNRPADMGYYIGYKICEAYYSKHSNKKQAIRDILNIKDFEKFLKDSAYAP